MVDSQNPDYKVQIVDAVLFVRKAVLSPTVQMAHIKALEKGTAKYPIRPADCKVYSIPQGATKGTSCRVMTLVKATPSSASI